jgi:Tfp pilus assembly protein PilN
MIKINLLGVAAPKPRAVAAAAPASKVVQLGVFVGALVVCLAIVGVFYMLWSASIDSLNAELRKQRVEQARLAGIKQENAKYEQERRLLEQRINTIQVLQASRVGPTEFMNVLANVVNKTTNDLYLFSVAPQGERVVIRGQAASPNSVAALLSYLKTSGYFEDVQLRQFYEDDVQDLASYKFNLDCAYKPSSAAASLVTAGAGARVPATPRRPGT